MEKCAYVRLWLTTWTWRAMENGVLKGNFMKVIRAQISEVPFRALVGRRSVGSVDSSAEISSAWQGVLPSAKRSESLCRTRNVRSPKPRRFNV